MNILFETSIAASFLAGAMALFAPCCVTFMLPSYFAFAFKQKRLMILMTFVFFFGVATIVVPIGLGVAFLSSLFKSYHREAFYLGGIFLVLLSYLSISGKTLSIPFHKNPPDLKKNDALSVYLLGLFSGLASSCCAPVLVGVLSLTALSANMFQALILSLTYVFGMVFPLFLMAYFWERFHVGENKIVKNGIGRLKELSNVIAALIFFSMGIYTLYLAAANKITSVSPSQTQFIAYMTIVQKKILSVTNWFPDWVFLLIILSIMALLFLKAKKNSS